MLPARVEIFDGQKLIEMGKIKDFAISLYANDFSVRLGFEKFEFNRQLFFKQQEVTIPSFKFFRLHARN